MNEDQITIKNSSAAPFLLARGALLIFIHNGYGFFPSTSIPNTSQYPIKGIELELDREIRL